MRCVVHSTPTTFLAHQLADMREQIGARLDVEADRRLVEKQQPRTMQQRAGDFDAAHLAAGERAHLVLGAVREAGAR